MVLGGAAFRAALAASLGMVSAAALQVALGAVGLASVLHDRPQLFTAFRWVGAGVLLAWAALALRSALRPGDAPALPDAPSRSRSTYLQGFLCTGSNPKVGIFLMAFLPQFVPASAPPVAGVTVLAAAYLSMGFLWLMIWTRLSRTVATRYLNSRRASRVAQAGTAVVLAFFASRMALT
ncbi:LysE family translocator [Plantactinospora sp. KBS50]|uniref:LysE family translocator n=1 Tax=Plantactinospora sp. KBS50 TaxID=2024580 RepID=UPI001E398FF5|nr:LysE family translocator [Plantactinospora sp. KBS50]